jgi:hypothetical protein
MDGGYVAGEQQQQHDIRARPVFVACGASGVLLLYVHFLGCLTAAAAAGV